jgi:hypothetical protein
VRWGDAWLARQGSRGQTGAVVTGGTHYNGVAEGGFGGVPTG